ncbi:chorismate-binding protein, partial [Pseudomonas fluorescens]|uniref:chorismate-binding protein n=1 Tax=Pseudomonas fluorescens TaxID=294 RepID=UPI001614DBF9
SELVVIFDHARRTLKIVACSLPRDKPRQAYDAAVSLIEEAFGRLQAPARLHPLPAPARGAPEPAWRSNVSREAYLEAVRRAKEYIAAGDIFQVVLSQRLSVPFRSVPFDVYRIL